MKWPTADRRAPAMLVFRESGACHLDHPRRGQPRDGSSTDLHAVSDSILRSAIAQGKSAWLLQTAAPEPHR